MLGFFFVLGILMLPSVARAEATPAERWACQQDAFRVCGHAIPDRDRVRSCSRNSAHRCLSVGASSPGIVMFLRTPLGIFKQAKQPSFLLLARMLGKPFVQALESAFAE
jgi:hypothetical protein